MPDEISLRLYEAAQVAAYRFLGPQYRLTVSRVDQPPAYVAVLSWDNGLAGLDIYVDPGARILLDSCQLQDYVATLLRDVLSIGQRASPDPS